VRAEAPEVVARPPPRGLHLVGDEQDAAGVEHLLVLAEQAVGGHGEAAHALDGLGDQARHLAGGAGRQQVLQVSGAGGDVLAVGHPREARQLPVRAVQVVHAERGQRGALPRQVAGDRDRAERAAVVAVAHRQHLVGAAGGGGQHERGLVRLGAGVGEEHLGVLDPGQPGQLLRQLDLAADQVQRRGVDDAGGELALDGLAHLGDVVAEHVGEDAAEEVQVGAAGGVGDTAAGAADEFQGVLVVQSHPVREDGAVAVD
jgi:hypothetical protein